MDFLIRTEFTRPAEMSDVELTQLKTREAEQADVLQRAGTIRHLWREVGTTTAWGHWESQDESTVRAAIRTLPLSAWMTIELHHVIDHPNALIQQQPFRRTP